MATETFVPKQLRAKKTRAIRRALTAEQVCTRCLTALLQDMVAYGQPSRFAEGKEDSEGNQARAKLPHLEVCREALD